ncbi:unnamed protein product [[Actinomadura] parvosata subsp. kistnae]|nr:unnamed protein product [Actinomadura parvosata subsp. kistnae]
MTARHTDSAEIAAAPVRRRRVAAGPARLSPHTGRMRRARGRLLPPM